MFEFGDQGGLLVMARHQTHGPADHVKFSMDEGRCWHRVNLTEAIDIINIRSPLFPFIFQPAWQELIQAIASICPPPWISTARSSCA